MTEKKVYPLRVQIYFNDEVKDVYTDLIEVCNITGWTISEVAFNAFVTGFYEIRDQMIAQKFNYKKRKIIQTGRRKKNVKGN